MSKSLGNIVNPLDLINKFGCDAFRYFLMREMNVGQDSDFSFDLFLSRYNSDLGNDLGNLLSRLQNMLHRYCEGKVPTATISEDFEVSLKSEAAETASEAVRLFDGMQFHLGLDKIFSFIRSINRYAEQRAPWKLAKSQDPRDIELLKTTLANMAEALRVATVLLTPVMPEISAKILTLLGTEKVDAYANQTEFGNSLESLTIGEKTILFPRPE